MTGDIDLSVLRPKQPAAIVTPTPTPTPSPVVKVKPSTVSKPVPKKIIVTPTPTPTVDLKSIYSGGIPSTTEFQPVLDKICTVFPSGDPCFHASQRAIHFKPYLGKRGYNYGVLGIKCTDYILEKGLIKDLINDCSDLFDIDKNIEVGYFLYTHDNLKSFRGYSN